jgi:glycosyltransferase EpsF
MSSGARHCGGGSEQVILNYCSRMKDIQFDMLFQYEPNPQILERFQEANINCIQVPDKVHHPIKHIWAMYRQFKTGQYNVVHSHLDWYMNSYACLLAMLAGVKTRIAHHHQAYRPENFLQKHFVLYYEYPIIICNPLVSLWQRSSKKWLGKISGSQRKVTILPNAVDPKKFEFDEEKRKAIRSQLGISEDTICIGHVGRFYPQKNHSFLIQIFSEYHKNNPKSVLLLVGDGSLQLQVKKQVDELGLSNAVIFSGLQKDSAPFYSAMDVFCFPSLWEGLPLVLIEVQYNGLPAIVSKEITSEAKISEGGKWISLEESKLWQAELKKVTLRGSKTTIIDASEFDINKKYQDLEKIYLEVLICHK